jgi:hypothetical protein
MAIAEGEKRPAALGAPEAEPAPAEVNQVEFPYVGEITGAELNIRSGPGMNFYSCGKISSPARVVVVGQKFSWSQILPPQGSFSWIFKQYVQTDVNNPGVGVVNADNTRVYAGADDRDAMVSDSIQIALKKGQKVRLIGAAVGDYYKIVPPEGASLWTSSQYVKFLRKADGIDIKVTKSVIASGTSTAKPGVLIEQVDANSRELELYYTLVNQLDEEKAKPLAEQNFARIKAELTALAEDANSGKAGQYAKYTLKTVARCELAKESTLIIEDQKNKLQNQLAEIEKARKEQKQTITDISKFAIIGTFKPSLLYADLPANKRYLVVDDSNTPVCYAEADGAIADANLTEFFGKRVGLVGEITTDTLSSFSLIKFTEIELFEKPAPQAETPSTTSEPNTVTPSTTSEPNAVAPSTDSEQDAEKK